jgi:hypothetical protein
MSLQQNYEALKQEFGKGDSAKCTQLLSKLKVNI